MKKIIKGAFTRFRTDCQKCGCEFEYELEDVVTGLEVKCPDCGFHTPHHSDDGLASSRKLEDDFPNCQLSGCEAASKDCHKTCPHGKKER